MKSENNVYGTNKYHRKNPIKEFDLNQTMYSLVTNESKDDLDLKATGFMGHDMSYRDLIISSDKLFSYWSITICFWLSFNFILRSTSKRL